MHSEEEQKALKLIVLSLSHDRDGGVCKAYNEIQLASPPNGLCRETKASTLEDPGRSPLDAVDLPD